jgi:hypothetical protein
MALWLNVDLGRSQRPEMLLHRLQTMLTETKPVGGNLGKTRCSTISGRRSSQEWNIWSGSRKTVLYFFLCSESGGLEGAINTYTCGRSLHEWGTPGKVLLWLNIKSHQQIRQDQPQEFLIRSIRVFGLTFLLWLPAAHWVLNYLLWSHKRYTAAHFCVFARIISGFTTLVLDGINTQIFFLIF